MNKIKDLLIDCWDIITQKDFWLLVFMALFLSQILRCSTTKETIIYRVIVPTVEAPL